MCVCVYDGSDHLMINFHHSSFSPFPLTSHSHISTFPSVCHTVHITLIRIFGIFLILLICVADGVAARRPGNKNEAVEHPSHPPLWMLTLLNSYSAAVFNSPPSVHLLSYLHSKNLISLFQHDLIWKWMEQLIQCLSTIFKCLFMVSIE